MAVHEALRLYGINYEVDPQSAYDTLSQSPEQIDYLQFPRQTMEYKAGDCDDLSILYAAMLESIGVETAFITIPGHIYMAFSTDLSPKDAANQLLDARDLILREERVWIPLEVTERNGNFLKAWQVGAQQWRQYSPENQAGFYPVREAWAVYEPVGSPGTEIQLKTPSEKEVLGSYEESKGAFMAQIIFPKIQDLERRVTWTKADAAKLNRLGILYAQFGDPNKAIEVFERILKLVEYTPALINLGNVAYMRKDWMKALEYYERAQRRQPQDSTIKLNIARTHYAMENYGLVRRLYEDIQKSDPELAERFSYLGGGAEGTARADAVSQAKEAVLWEEE
jgi:tetratricopeptide (TPR) repeat protein